MKKSILDFLSETDDSFIHIELQQNDTSYFDERVTYYLTKIARLKKGKEYKEFKNVISIIIVNFNMNKLPNYKHEFLFIDTKNLNYIFNQKLKIIIIQLEKFREIKKDWNNKEHLYLTFFDKNTSHERRKELGKMDEGLNSAVKKIERALQDDDAMRIYHKIEWEKMVEEKEKIRIQKEKEKEREEGREEGIEEGMELEKIKIANKMKNKGISLQEIAEFTGLSYEFIEKL